VPRHVFIDTNIYLAFYHLTSDELEELEKLRVLLQQKKVVLHVPDQVSMEFRRNRDIKIADALKRFGEQRLALQFPQMCKDYAAYQQLRDLQKEYEKTHAELLATLTDDIHNENLKADATISGLFRLANTIASEPTLLASARLRMERGNPPGKDGSLGDAINWEALLVAVPNNSDLYLVSDDRDYCSALDPERFHPYLDSEWQQGKASSVYFYKKLSAFFKDHFPNIKLARELEKDLLIKELANSSTFAKTHTVIAKLRRCGEFTKAQAAEVASAILGNNQVSWIATDEDVESFITDLLAKYGSHLPADDATELQELIRQDTHEAAEGREEDEWP